MTTFVYRPKMQYASEKNEEKSMSQDNGSYQLPHIYDKLSVRSTSSGEQKSFRGKQQRLPKQDRFTEDLRTNRTILEQFSHLP